MSLFDIEVMFAVMYMMGVAGSWLGRRARGFLRSEVRRLEGERQRMRRGGATNSVGVAELPRVADLKGRVSLGRRNDICLSKLTGNGSSDVACEAPVAAQVSLSAEV